MESGSCAPSISASKQKEAVVSAVVNAINAVIAEGRDVPSSTTLRYIIEYKSRHLFDEFCTNLYLALEECFVSVGQVRHQLARERAFTKFHQIRLERLPLVWKRLFIGLGVPPIPALQQQTVNFRLFNDMVVAKFNTPCIKCEKLPTKVHLSWEEENAVRHAGGYVINKLAKQYMKMETTKAAQLVECLLSMGNAVSQESSQTETSSSSRWTETVDRGGLFHINNSTMNFFKSVEICTQKHLAQHLCSSDASKAMLLESITEDNDVHLYWNIIATDISDEQETDELLTKVVETWVTIRGFAVTSSWLEQHKMSTNKTNAKGKSLRRELDNKFS